MRLLPDSAIWSLIASAAIIGLVWILRAAAVSLPEVGVLSTLPSYATRAMARPARGLQEAPRAVDSGRWAGAGAGEVSVEHPGLHDFRVLLEHLISAI